MNKNMRLALIAALVVGAGYLAFRWWRNRQNPTGNTGGGLTLGTNLNSRAPELIGTTAAGPTAGPAVDLPVNVTLTETYNSAEKVSARKPKEDADVGSPVIQTQPLEASNAATTNPLMAPQNDAGVQPQGAAVGVSTGTDDTGDTTDVSNGS